jgi:hypothetical protein
VAAQQARAAFLKQQADLRSGLAQADQDGRAKIHEQLQAAREQFLADQHQAREDLRKRLDDLKQQLPQHQDVIDSAKQDVKGQVHARKGN